MGVPEPPLSKNMINVACCLQNNVFPNQLFL